jgi:ABC-type antimicrobial peptide transport system permease subunit
VLAFSVSGRTREFGIRLALGAQPGRILAGVIFEGTVLAVLGVGVGFFLGFVGSRILNKYIAELQIPGPLPLIAAGALILLAAVVASMIPAARAARVDAASTLRGE